MVRFAVGARGYHRTMRKNDSNQSGGTIGARLSAFLALPVPI